MGAWLVRTVALSSPLSNGSDELSIASCRAAASSSALI